jgi:predicted site-specific integrase-resolvase
MELLEKNKTNVKNVNSKKVNIIMEGKQKIIYARVSSIQQKNDLERQIKVLKTKYPTYELITDIGSGINMKRRGLLKIINNSIKGRVEEIVIVHRDRLCRFGYELIKYLVKEYSNGKITVLAEENKKEPKEELVDDILQIMNIFVAKINGMRKYKKIEN